MPLCLDGVDVFHDVGVVELLEEVDLTLISSVRTQINTQGCGWRQQRTITRRHGLGLSTSEDINLRYHRRSKYKWWLSTLRILLNLCNNHGGNEEDECSSDLQHKLGYL